MSESVQPSTSTSNVARTVPFLLAAIVLIALGMWLGRLVSPNSVTPKAQIATFEEIGNNGGSLVLMNKGATSPSSFAYSPEMTWIDSSGTVHQGGMIPCLQPSARGRQLTYGLVSAKASGPYPGTDLVAWVACTG